MLLAISIHDCTLEKQVLLLALFFSLHFIKVIFFPFPNFKPAQKDLAASQDMDADPGRDAVTPHMLLLILS